MTPDRTPAPAQALAGVWLVWKQPHDPYEHDSLVGIEATQEAAEAQCEVLNQVETDSGLRIYHYAPEFRPVPGLLAQQSAAQAPAEAESMERMLKPYTGQGVTIQDVPHLYDPETGQFFLSPDVAQVLYQAIRAQPVAPAEAESGIDSVTICDAMKLNALIADWEARATVLRTESSKADPDGWYIAGGLELAVDDLRAALAAAEAGEAGA